MLNEDFSTYLLGVGTNNSLELLFLIHMGRVLCYILVRNTYDFVTNNSFEELFLI